MSEPISITGIWASFANCVPPKYRAHLWHKSGPLMKTLCGVYTLRPGVNTLIPSVDINHQCRRCRSIQQAA